MSKLGFVLVFLIPSLLTVSDAQQKIKGTK
jgi:hypothetical protein